MRFGFRLAPTTSTVEETVAYLQSDDVTGGRVTDQMPDLIVADLDLPGGGAVELCRRVAEGISVLVVTYGHGEEAVLDAVAEGAWGYIVRAAGVESAQMSMARAVLGEPVINSSLAGMILSHYRTTDDCPDSGLTAVEKRIIQLRARNYGLGELADTVQLSAAEVESAIRVLFAKFQCSRRAVLAAR